MKKYMNQPHYHKDGWVKHDEAQSEINELADIAEQIYALLTKETDESNRLYNRLNKIRAKHR